MEEVDISRIIWLRGHRGRSRNDLHKLISSFGQFGVLTKKCPIMVMALTSEEATPHLERLGRADDGGEWLALDGGNHRIEIVMKDDLWAMTGLKERPTKWMAMRINRIGRDNREISPIQLDAISRWDNQLQDDYSIGKTDWEQVWDLKTIRDGTRAGKYPEFLGAKGRGFNYRKIFAHLSKTDQSLSSAQSLKKKGGVLNELENHPDVFDMMKTLYDTLGSSMTEIMKFSCLEGSVFREALNLCPKQMVKLLEVVFNAEPPVRKTKVDICVLIEAFLFKDRLEQWLAEQIQLETKNLDRQQNFRDLLDRCSSRDVLEKMLKMVRMNKDVLLKKYVHIDLVFKSWKSKILATDPVTKLLFFRDPPTKKTPGRTSVPTHENTEETILAIYKQFDEARDFFKVKRNELAGIVVVEPRDWKKSKIIPTKMLAKMKELLYSGGFGLVFCTDFSAAMSMIKYAKRVGLQYERTLTIHIKNPKVDKNADGWTSSCFFAVILRSKLQKFIWPCSEGSALWKDIMDREKMLESGEYPTELVMYPETHGDAKLDSFSCSRPTNPRIMEMSSTIPHADGPVLSYKALLYALSCTRPYEWLTQLQGINSGMVVDSLINLYPTHRMPLLASIFSRDTRFPFVYYEYPHCKDNNIWSYVTTEINYVLSAQEWDETFEEYNIFSTDPYCEWYEEPSSSEEPAAYSDSADSFEEYPVSKRKRASSHSGHSYHSGQRRSKRRKTEPKKKKMKKNTPKKTYKRKRYN